MKRDPRASQLGIEPLERRNVGAIAPPRRRWRWRPGWQFWVVSLGLAIGGAGFVAVALLLRLPAVPNCPAIFWPTASASMRLYCGQIAANKKTVEDLLEAIRLVDDLPADHALRPTLDQYIYEWALELLELGEQSYQQGDLEEAIEIARRVPAHIWVPQGEESMGDRVRDRIDRWKTTWAEAEAIVEKTQRLLRQQRWSIAFREAVKLLAIDNQYWQTKRYEQLSRQIQAAREDGRKLDEAAELADRDDADSLVAAIEMLETIGVDSFAYQKARENIGEYGGRMLDLARAAIDDRDLSAALSIARKIPDSAGIEEEADDFIVLARARFQAWRPTVRSLEAAIAQAQSIGPDRPLYGEARDLIELWQVTIDQVAILERARDFARNGSSSDLSTAIAQAQLVSTSTPLWDEAKREIERWERQLAIIEDRPYLSRAQQLARNGNIDAALQEVSRIDSSRPIYQEARNDINEWQQDKERREDAPILERARALANEGNFSRAIAVAEEIRSGRALYPEAQSEIASWRDTINSQAALDRAVDLSRNGSPSSLAAAIATADTVASGSIWRPEADRYISQWSQQLLTSAREVALGDLNEAIDIARRIPRSSRAYSEAQRQIEDWQRLLAPPIAPQPTTAAPEPAAPEIPEKPTIDSAI